MSLRYLIVSAAALALFTSAVRAETIKVGVTAGPHAQILEAVKSIAAKHGLNIKIVEFTDYAVPKDAILREDPKGPYTNLIAVRADDKDKPWVKTLVTSYQTPEVRDFILTKFKGAVLPAW
jgi:ABC-type metal ion transport system substrate-binding protein